MRGPSTILQRFPYLKSFLAGPWKLFKTSSHATSTVRWQWTRFGVVLLLGFHGLQRPCEVSAPKVKDPLLASETGCQEAIFLRLQLVKNRTRGPRMQSVRIDVPYVVTFLKKCFKAMTPEQQIL